MEKASGIPLGRVWDTMEPADKVKVFLEIFGHQKKWTATKFTSFGSLYYSRDIEGASKSPGHLYVDKDGNPVDEPRFCVGPAVGREWMDEGRQKLQCDRGPCE